MLTAPGGCRFRQFAWALLALAWSGAATAAYELVPYGSITAEYNSNVFSLPSSEVALAENGDDQLSDSVLRYLAGVEASLPWRQQKLRGLLELRRMDFVHFGDLDHNGYLMGAGLDWRVTGTFDGALDYRQERRMAPFSERNTTELALETERILSVGANLVINPEWRFESGLRLRRLDSPLPDFPDFAIKENSLNAAIKYLSIDRLVAGLFAEYLTGAFEGVPSAGDFHQESLAATADYTISEISRIGGKLGYTRRKDDGGGTLSGLTGSLAYHRDLTGKTAADVQVFRRVRSYAGGASSVLETGFGAGVAWRITEKISLTGAGEWVKGTFEEASASSTDAGRTDDSQTLSLRMNYQALPWLAVRPYTGYQRRNSTIDRDDFRAAIVGLEVQARFQYRGENRSSTE